MAARRAAPRPVDAIILAGGRGTRLRAAVPGVPKPLAPVGGRPFLDLLLERLARSGRVRRVVLAVGYRAALFKKRYEGSRAFGLPVACSVERTPRGTGGAFRLALRRTRSAEVVLGNGDTLVDVDFGRLLDAHARRRARLTLVVAGVRDAARYGTVEVDRTGRTGIAYREKQPGHRRAWINAGWYVIDRRLASRIPASRPVSLEREILPAWIPGCSIVPARGRFIDIGTPASYAAAARLLAHA
jgi:NDP-sugar pyrophosphorylase family protein